MYKCICIHYACYCRQYNYEYLYPIFVSMCTYCGPFELCIVYGGWLMLLFDQFCLRVSTCDMNWPLLHVWLCFSAMLFPFEGNETAYLSSNYDMVQKLRNKHGDNYMVSLRWKVQFPDFWRTFTDLITA